MNTPSSLTRSASTSSIATATSHAEPRTGCLTGDRLRHLHGRQGLNASAGLGLSDPGLLPVIEQHQKFFAAKSRRQALERLLSDGDDATRLPCEDVPGARQGTGNKLTDIVRELLVENAARKTDKFDELLTYDLDQFFWDGLGSIYKYQRTTPTIDDFVLWMFERAIEDFASTIPDEFRNIRSDFNSLRYDVRTQNAMTTTRFPCGRCARRKIQDRARRLP